MVESDLVLKKKNTSLENIISQDILVSCNKKKRKKKKKKDSGMNFISHQNSCFAPLSDLALRCTSVNDQNQSEAHYCSYIIIKGTFDHFMYCMHVLMFRNTFMKKYQNVIVI